MTFIDVLVAEFRKARTLRPLVGVIAASVIVMAVLCVSDAPITIRYDQENPSPGDAALVTRELGLYWLSNLAVIPLVVGVLAASQEHIGGQLSTTALAVPTRIRVVVAKLVVGMTVNALLAAVLAALITATYQLILGDRSALATGYGTALMGQFVGGAVFWALLGLLGTAVATAVRSQIVALAALVLLASVTGALTGMSTYFHYLPTVVGDAMFMSEPIDPAEQRTLLSPMNAFLVQASWTLAAVVAALIVFKRRDIGARQAAMP